MYSETAQYYDLIYSQFKDYEQECEKIEVILRKYHPNAKTVLDVGCGTGEHARILHEQYNYLVDGLDLDKAFVEIARRKMPFADFYHADMADFSLNKKYDVILCLFSSIGYVKTLNNITSTLQTFRNHLTKDGIICVEPWLTPNLWQPGKMSMVTAENKTCKICRISVTEKTGSVSTIHFHYLIGSKDGVSYKEEIHELGLFTTDEMIQCFQNVDLKVNFDPIGIFNRGLYVAR